MKKAFFIILVLLFIIDITRAGVIPPIAQEAISQVDTFLKDVDTSMISHRLYNDVKAALVSLGEALSIGAEHVYRVIVKQMVANAIAGLAIFIIGIVLLLLSFKALRNPNEDWGSMDDSPTFLGVFRAFQMIIGVVMAAYGIFSIDTIVSGLFNPEFGAINYILDHIAKLL